MGMKQEIDLRLKYENLIKELNNLEKELDDIDFTKYKNLFLILKKDGVFKNGNINNFKEDWDKLHIDRNGIFISFASQSDRFTNSYILFSNNHTSNLYETGVKLIYQIKRQQQRGYIEISYNNIDYNYIPTINNIYILDKDKEGEIFLKIYNEIKKDFPNIELSRYFDIRFINYIKNY